MSKEKMTEAKSEGELVATRLKRRVVSSVVVPGGAPYDVELKRGQVLRIIDLEGQQGVDFLCFNKDNTEERYNLAHSIKKAATLNLTKGHVLYSDAARPMMTIIEDTCGHNDTIAGCCTEQTNWLFYGKNDSKTSCRANFLGSMKKYGLGRRDLVGNLNFFCIVPVAADMSIPALTFADAPSKAGDFIDLRAEMNLICLISNCPQVNNPCSGGNPSPIQVVVWDEE
jgi:urea carboxylase-associated protein 1